MNVCDKVRRLLGPFVYEDLCIRDRDMVEAHLSECEVCRAEYESCRLTVQRVPRNLSPSGVKERLISKVTRKVAQGEISEV